MNKKFLLPFLLTTLSIASCSMDGFFNPTSPSDSSGGDEYVVETFDVTKVEIISSSGKMKVSYNSPRINPFKYPGLTFDYLTVNGERSPDYMSTEYYHSQQYFEVTPPSEKNKTSYTFKWYASDGYPYYEATTNNVTQYSGGTVNPGDEDEGITYPTGYSKLIFQDEFDGNSVNTAKWGYDVGGWGWGNDESQYYTEGNNSSVKDGYLTITAKEETIGSNPYTSSRMVTKGKFSFKYGYIEGRIALPEIQGMWPAFWMLPETNVYGGWPYSGEIDIMEARGRVNNSYGSAIHHTTGEVNGGHTYESHDTTFKTGTLKDFHLYACEWKEDQIKFYIDGTLHFTVSSSQWFTSHDLTNTRAPFDQNFHLILNLAVGGQFDGYKLPPAGFGTANMLVDYVRVFQK